MELHDYLDRNLAPQSGPEDEEADAPEISRFPRSECEGEDEGLGGEILEKPGINGFWRSAACNAEGQ